MDSLSNDAEKRRIQLMAVRLELFYRQRDLHRSAFATAIGENQAKLLRGLEGVSGSAEYLIKVKETFPMLNLRWLLSGHGPMLVPDPTQEQKPGLRAWQDELNEEVLAVKAMPEHNAPLMTQKLNAVMDLIPELQELRTLLDGMREDILQGYIKIFGN